jgi:hypothetical protein
MSSRYRDDGYRADIRSLLRTGFVFRRDLSGSGGTSLTVLFNDPAHPVIRVFFKDFRTGTPARTAARALGAVDGD